MPWTLTEAGRGTLCRARLTKPQSPAAVWLSGLEKRGVSHSILCMHAYYGPRLISWMECGTSQSTTLPSSSRSKSGSPVATAQIEEERRTSLLPAGGLSVLGDSSLIHGRDSTCVKACCCASPLILDWITPIVRTESLALSPWSS